MKLDLDDASISALTHKQILDIVLRNEREVRSQLIIALNEKSIEDLVVKIRFFWEKNKVEMILNHDKQRYMIDEWDNLLNKISEDLNSLTAIKLSPYYEVFAEETVSLEENLKHIKDVLDVWIDVQRSWVYLEGIVSSGADIQVLLPVVTASFECISSSP